MAYVMTKNELTTVCPNCGCTIGYAKDETYMGCDKDGNDGLVIDCPNCGDMILVEKCDPMEWPKAFYHFGAGEDATHLSDDEIQKMIDKCVRNMMVDKTNEYYYVATGDTMVFTFWDEGNMDVYVAKNYHSAFLDEEYLNKRFENHCAPCTTKHTPTVYYQNPRTKSERLLDIPNANVTQEIVNKANRYN